MITLTWLYISINLSVLQFVNPLASYSVVYCWKQIDFNFPSAQIRNWLLNSGEFIPKNNIIAGIKVKDDRIFLTVPRWAKGVPATLTYVQFDPTLAVGANGPLLNPFPSWEMNELGNCNAFQYVQSMEIDQFGRMWVIDVGRLKVLTGRSLAGNECPPKLVLLDLATGKVIRKYDFPQDVVSRDTNFLNDIVVGCISKEDCYAYMSDVADAKIVVYNYAENCSWFVHHPSMIASKDALNINILGEDYQFMSNVDGIALSPKDTNFDRLYFCPLSSLNLYSVATSIIKDAANGDILPDHVVYKRVKSSQSDGLAMDELGRLFISLLGRNGVALFNTSSIFYTEEVLLIQSDEDLQWPDTLGFDNSGYLFTASNRLQQFGGDRYDFDDYNFRIVRVYVGARSYMFSAKEGINREGTRLYSQRQGVHVNQAVRIKYDHDYRLAILCTLYLIPAHLCCIPAFCTVNFYRGSANVNTIYAPFCCGGS